VNQYELTYINHIPEGKGEHFPAEIERYVPLLSWKAAQSSKFLPPPGSAGLNLGFSLPDKKGRLHVTLNHAQRQDGGGLVVLELTARGPGAPDWSNMESWLSLAHEWIVRGFTDLTSPAAHEQWRRTR